MKTDEMVTKKQIATLMKQINVLRSEVHARNEAIASWIADTNMLCEYGPNARLYDFAKKEGII